MEKYELQKLRDLPIEGVAERLGLRVERHKCLCPFHDDRHPSLSFSVRKNTCRCFVCMTQSIGPIDLVMRHLGKDFLDACRWLADEHNVILNWEVKEVSEVKEVKTFDASRYERFFERPFLNEEARHFLFDERKLDPRVVRWCRLTSWRDKQGIPWLQIPYFNREGKLVGIQNRNLRTPGVPLSGQKSNRSDKSGNLDNADDNHLKDLKDFSPEATEKNREGGGSAPRFRFPQGSQCGIYNLPVLNLLKPGDDLYIAEGCSDCWSLLSAGHKAIAIPSATLLSQKDIKQLLSLTLTFPLSFHIWPDNDAPGERLFLQLREVLPNLVHHQLPQGCKDFSELYLKGRLSNNK